MVAEITDIINMLSTMIEEETDLLCAPGPHHGLQELVAAKARLVGQIAACLDRLAHDRPSWRAELDSAARDRLAAATRLLIDAATLNGTVLERQIALSAELMTEIGCEAKRLIGARNATYSAHACMLELERSAPNAIDNRRR